MNKKIACILTVLSITVGTITGCATQADVVSQNLSKEADNFNVLRQVTVINCIGNDILFQMTGKMSISKDNTDNQLEIVVEDEDGSYQKGLIGLSDNVTYIVNDLETNYVSRYKFTINYNPKMWLPVEIKTIN